LRVECSAFPGPSTAVATETPRDGGRAATLAVEERGGSRNATRRILYNHGIDAEPVSTGTTSFLYFRDSGTVDAAYEVLSRYDQFEVIRTSAPPPYMHLGRGPRVPPLIVSARPPYFIEDPKLWPWWLRWLGDYGPEFMWAQMSLKASHGYPPDEDGMPGLLYAWGSGVAKGREVARVEAIDLHPTVMHLLGISPGVPVDGQVARDLLDS